MSDLVGLQATKTNMQKYTLLSHGNGSLEGEAAGCGTGHLHTSKSLCIDVDQL